MDSGGNPLLCDFNTAVVEGIEGWSN